MPQGITDLLVDQELLLHDLFPLGIRVDIELIRIDVGHVLVPMVASSTGALFGWGPNFLAVLLGKFAPLGT